VAAGSEHAASLAVAIPLIREEHQPELAHDGIEGAFQER
jgi:hypothetical protein